MENLLLKLRKNKIGIQLVNGALKLDIPKYLDAQEILEEIKKNKNELIKFIQNTQAFKTDYKVIEKAPEKEYYTLSSAQKRMYFLYEYNKTSLNYNTPQVVCLDGDLNADLVKEVFNKLINRHESLRTIFKVIDEKPVQKILENQEIDIEFFNSSPSEVPNIVQEFIRPFDLNNGPLIRVGVIRLEQEKHILILDMHHIITDGVSDSILVKEFMTLYTGETLAPLSLQYKDYAEWQQQKNRQLEISEQKEFWLNLFKDEVQPINLPSDFKRPNIKGHQGATISFDIDEKQAKKLKSISEESGSTDFMTLLSGYYILLHKLTNQNDIVIGTPVAGREHEDLNGMIGMFVNTLPLRNQIKKDITFKEFLAQIKTNTLACIRNQSYQYESLIEELKVERDTSRNPLFDIMFSYQNFTEQEVDIPGLKLSSYDKEDKVSKFDLSLIATEKNGRFTCKLAYSIDLFTKETINRFITYYKRIVTAIIENPDLRLSEICILSEEERYDLTEGFNATDVVFSEHASVLDIFDAQVIQTPDCIAVAYRDETISYKDLSRQASQMSSYLLTSKGVELEERVGIMLDRESILIPAIYGILKSGCAYVPIDPKLPSARVKAILKDAGIRVLITRGEYLTETVLAAGIEVIDLNKEVRSISQSTVLDVYPEISSDHLAYIIYTSGSTGTPKGVMIEHGSLLNTIQSMDSLYPLTSDDVYMFKTTHSFDVSVAELFGWFHSGGKLLILPSGFSANTDKIIEQIDRSKVTHISFVPSMFSIFVEGLKSTGVGKLSSLKYIFLAGEALPSDLISDFNALNTGIVLENIYGPTEATIYCSRYSTSAWHGQSRVPIGKPLSNMKLFVLDPNSRLVPVGVAGELCIGGASLSRGYMNNEILTSSKFVKIADLGDQRVYKTGDLARWLPDGNIEYLGRIDDQVKIRGFRIELEEISSCLNQYPEIATSVVVVKETSGDKFIVAYYRSDSEFSSAILKEFLSKHLPEYMLPTFYVHLTEFPLNSSGKIDRKNLPEPKIELQDNYVAPSNIIENQIATMWSDVLSIDKELISINKSFFELGGHSLKAMVLVNKIAKEFDMVFPLEKVFEKPTIREQAEFIDINQWLFSDNSTDLEQNTEMAEEIII